MANPPLSALDTDTGEGPRLLRVNEFGTARVLVDTIPNALLVPAQAVQRLADQTAVVFVARPDGVTFEPRQVTLGQTEGGLVHIRSGVQPHERVVTTQSYILKSELMKDTLAAEH